MSFMQPEVRKGAAWLVETYNGTECVPDDVVSLEPFHGDDDSAEYSEWLSNAIAALRDYCEGPIIEVPSAPVEGWLGRYHAPGYMDSTEWSLYDSEADALASLKAMYGDDEEEEEEEEEAEEPDAWICGECLLWMVNRDLSGLECDNPEEAERIKECCANYHECCHPANDDSDSVYLSFSHRRCDCCNGLPGERHAVVWLD